MKNRKNSTRMKAVKASLLGILASESVALSFFENLIPQFIPFPASRVGLSNIVTMFAVSSCGFSYGIYITLFKAAFALLTRGVTASVLSLCGGMLSLAVMCFLFRLPEEKVSCVFIGAVCALFHNAGQLAAAYVILGKYVLSLSPYLVITAIVSGVFTGIIYRYTLSAFIKQQNKITLLVKER